MTRLLIWNRGEIAVRIAIAAQRLGVPCVAAMLPGDAESRVRAFADEVVVLPDDRPERSYLDLALLADVLARTGVTHVHPGYGLLAESPAFARAVADAGAAFVGPPETVLAEMASKTTSRGFAHDAGLRELTVALLGDRERGYTVPPDTRFPLMLKADRGGGGRGNRVVRSADELDACARELTAFAAAQFGDDRLFAERFLPHARHVEVQFFALPGRGVRLLDSRDGSVQRRLQKVLEEGPAPNRALAAMGPHRLGIERALSRRGFRGAGTVELLYDERTGELFFLEVNPRIQVEHPVTEMRLGIDLVEWQLREALDRDAHALFDELDAPRCHVIEARVYAERVDEGFAPEVGTVRRIESPGLPWARWDTSLRDGGRVLSGFDPLVAKLLVVGADRAEAIARLRIALAHARVEGVATNLPLLRAVVASETFAKDAHHSAWLEAALPALRCD